MNLKSGFSLFVSGDSSSAKAQFCRELALSLGAHSVPVEMFTDVASKDLLGINLLCSGKVDVAKFFLTLFQRNGITSLVSVDDCELEGLELLEKSLSVIHIHLSQMDDGFSALTSGANFRFAVESLPLRKVAETVGDTVLENSQSLENSAETVVTQRLRDLGYL